MDADAWLSTEYLARLVVSSAISTSTMRPRAARILVFCWPSDSKLNASLDCDPPFCALRKEMFSNAWVITPTEMLPDQEYHLHRFPLQRLHYTQWSQLHLALLAELKAAMNRWCLCVSLCGQKAINFCASSLLHLLLPLHWYRWLRCDRGFCFALCTKDTSAPTSFPC